MAAKADTGMGTRVCPRHLLASRRVCCSGEEGWGGARTGVWWLWAGLGDTGQGCITEGPGSSRPSPLHRHKHPPAGPLHLQGGPLGVPGKKITDIS